MEHSKNNLVTLFSRFLFTIVVVLVLTSACAGALPGTATTPTVYDLTQRPADFAGKTVTAQGFYLWRPGDPGMSVLLPGVSTADSTRDAQPIYASVECGTDGSCKPSTTEVGIPSTGAVWLDGFPADVTASLHRPADSVWGVVEVTGVFENSGNFGPDGSYNYRMQVSAAKALQQVERIVSEIPDEALPTGQVSLYELSRNPEAYAGQQVTTRGYYFWSPATQGSLVTRVEREKTPDEPNGISPTSAGMIIGMEGFPPDQSSTLNVGDNGSYVWGLVEVTGTFQTGSFADGRYQQQIVVTSARPLDETTSN